MPSADLTRLRHVFDSRAYLLAAIGNFASLVGSWAQRVAVGWLAWELTGSELWVGLVAFADLVPGVLAAPVAGALADRMHLVRLCIVLQLVGAALALALWACSFAHILDVYLLLALTFSLGTTNAFDHPVRLALLPSLVPKESLATAVGLNAVSFNLARFVGPLGSGYAIAAGHVEIVFGANAVSFIIFAGLLAAVSGQVEGPTMRDKERGFLRAIGDGYSYTVSHKGLFAFMAVLVVTSLGVRPVIDLLPPFADDLYAAGLSDHGAGALAIMTSTMALGAIFASAGLTLAGGTIQIDRLVIGSHLLASLSLIVFVVAGDLVVRLLALGICGFALVCLGVGTQTLIQLRADRGMRGRVLSLFTMINRGLPALGALAIGWAGSQGGLAAPFIAGAAAAGLIAAAMLVRR